MERRDGYGRVTLQWRNFTTLPQAGDQGQYQSDVTFIVYTLDSCLLYTSDAADE